MSTPMTMPQRQREATATPAGDAPPHAPAVRLQDVSMRYQAPRRLREMLLRARPRGDGILAVRDVTLDIRPNEIVAVTGENAAGKTTLLKLISGILYPTSGSVTISGHDTRAANRRARAHVGYVPTDERSFYWRLTGRENLQFFGALDNLHGRPLRERIERMGRAVGLADAMDRRVSDYSAGMRQRLSIARALLRQPRTLVLDEPTRSIDPGGTRQIERMLIEELAGEGRTIILATHDLHQAARVCNRLWVMSRGQLLSAASIDAVTREGSLEGFYHRSLETAELDRRAT